MTFEIGGQKVSPQNDGGIGIRYINQHGVHNWQPGGIRPVLSLEVFLILIIIDIGETSNVQEKGRSRSSL